MLHEYWVKRLPLKCFSRQSANSRSGHLVLLYFEFCAECHLSNRSDIPGSPTKHLSSKKMSLLCSLPPIFPNSVTTGECNLLLGSTSWGSKPKSQLDATVVVNPCQQVLWEARHALVKMYQYHAHLSGPCPSAFVQLYLRD